MTDARIVFYFDCASAFSYIGFEFMEKYKALWNIDVDYRPFILEEQALKGVVDETVVDQAMAASETLEAVRANVAHLKELKGFGAPTILAYKAGSTKPQLFFGSDRFEHLAMYLDREFFPMRQLFANAKI
ncbi:hypothetical protein GGI14_004646 [Coemansia sp. S680]|nr:hypothetical protein GGI14_004646 [Coemansia sp. S680]